MDSTTANNSSDKSSVPTPHNTSVLSDAALRFQSASRSASTQRAYRSDWNDFLEWCVHNEETSLPASGVAVANYLAHMAEGDGAKKSTVARRVAAINYQHEIAGHARPGKTVDVAQVLSGVRRVLSSELDRASPFTRELLLKAFSGFDERVLRDVRDKALLCIGFAAALRRSEIVSVQVADIKFKDAEGLMLRIPVSKTDQERAGQFVAVPYAARREFCPVVAVEHWLDMSGVTSGALFRGVRKNGVIRGTALNAGSVNEIVKRSATRAGVRAIDAQGFSGHSLRAGFVTTAREAGVPDHLIMMTTRHRDPRSLNGYDRPENLLENTAWGWAGW